MELEGLLLALKSYQSFNPSGWVGIYRVFPMWAGIASCVLGVALLLFGGNKLLFRVVAGPIGAVLGFLWTGVLAARLGLTDMDPRMPSMAAAALLALGFLFPPAITFLGIGLPLGLLGGQVAGTGDFVLGFAPTLILSGLVAAILHRLVSSVVASVVGAWLLVIGTLAALHSYGALMTVVANQPWGVIIAAALFALAGSVYQIAVRPSPEEEEAKRVERAQEKARVAERKAMEKRWGVK